MASHRIPVRDVREALGHYERNRDDSLQLFIYDLNTEITFSLRAGVGCPHMPYCPRRVILNMVTVRLDLRRSGVFRRFLRELIDTGYCVKIGQPSPTVVESIERGEFDGVFADLEYGSDPYTLSAQINPQLNRAGMSFSEIISFTKLDLAGQIEFVRNQQQPPNFLYSYV
jgi:hypothetical protein